MIRQRPELDTVNPPGQIVNPIPESKLYRPVHQGFPADTEEAFTPAPKRVVYLRDVIRRLQDSDGSWQVTENLVNYLYIIIININISIYI
jgi:hypothetical protein